MHSSLVLRFIVIYKVKGSLCSICKYLFSIAVFMKACSIKFNQFQIAEGSASGQLMDKEGSLNGMEYTFFRSGRRKAALIDM